MTGLSRQPPTANRQPVEFVFDDGGMNLLSSSALRRIRAELPDDASLFVFRSGRPSLFAAGADMAEMQRFTPFEAYDFARLGQELFAAIERLPFVTVALIDGDCFGGALDLTLAFDLRFATPRSRFAHPGARLGIVTGFGGTSRWRGVIDRRAANQLFLANRVFSASEALERGLVDRVGESFEEELVRLEGEEFRRIKMGSAAATSPCSTLIDSAPHGTTRDPSRLLFGGLQGQRATAAVPRR